MRETSVDGRQLSFFFEKFFSLLSNRQVTNSQENAASSSKCLETREETEARLTFLLS
jgi:hypothetical protein